MAMSAVYYWWAWKLDIFLFGHMIPGMCLTRGSIAVLKSGTPVEVPWCRSAFVSVVFGCATLVEVYLIYIGKESHWNHILSHLTVYLSGCLLCGIASAHNYSTMK